MTVKKKAAKAASKRKTTAKKKAVAKKKPAAKKTAAKKKVAKKVTARKTTAKKKTTASKKTSKKTTKKAAAKKTTAKKVTAKRSTAKKAAAKKPARKKATVSKISAAKRRNVALEGPEVKPYKETSGEDFMSEGQRDHFREILTAWKMELMQEVDRTVHHMKDEAANFPDPNDRATQESEFSLELRTRDRERKLIKKIDEALASVESGDYGYCESCGIEIGVRRLEARPTATQCIDCKTLDEIREKQMGGG